MPVVKPANRKNTVAPRPWRIGGLGTNILDADGDQIALVCGMPPIGNQGDTANAAHIVKAVNALENGNAAALREALVEARKVIEAMGGYWARTTLPIIDAALVAPARNCDVVPLEAPEAADVFHRERPCHGYCYETHDWLLAPAADGMREGGAK